MNNTLDFKMPKIIAVGCGTEGNYSISQLFKSGVAFVKTIAIDTDKSSLDTVQANSKILIENGYGEIASFDKKLIDEHSIQKLVDELKDVELLFVTSCMGNKICTEAITVITEICRKQESIVIGLVTIPSEKYSGNQKPKTEDIIELSKKADTVAFIDHDRVHKLYPDLPIGQIRSFSGKLIADMIGGIVECLNPEVVFLNVVDFDDLKTMMKNGGIGTLVINEVEDDLEKGHRAKRLADGLMQSLMMDIDANAIRNGILIFRQGNDSHPFEIEQVVSCAIYDFDSWTDVLWGSVETKDYYGKLRCMGIISGFNVAL